MGIISKLFKAQKEHIEKFQNKQQSKAQEKLEIMLSTTGFARNGKKGAFLGANKITKVFPQFNVDYIGGYFESPKGKENITIVLIPQGLLFEHIHKADIIPMSDIKAVSLKTEQEIKKNVTLTRMVAFGIYALALKKKKKVITHFVTVDCEKNGIKYTVVFGGQDSTQLYTTLFKRIAE